MKKYVIYNSPSGEIVAVGTCQGGLLGEIPLGTDERIMEGAADPETQRVSLVSGKPVICKRAVPLKDPVSPGEFPGDQPE